MAGKTSPAAGRKKTAAKKTDSKSRDPKKKSSPSKKAGGKQGGTKSNGTNKAGKTAQTTKSGSRKSSAKKGAGQKSGTSKAPAKKAGGKSAAAKKPVSGRTASKKRTSSRSSRSKTNQARTGSGLIIRFLGVLPTLLLVGGIALGLYIWFQATDPAILSPLSSPLQSAKENNPPRKTRGFEKKPGAAVPPADMTQAEASQGSVPRRQAIAKPASENAKPAESPDERPRAAIIIDDIGEDKAMAEQFFRLEAPLTYSILPHTRYQREIAEAAFRRGYQVMLHLPMEPNEYPGVDPGPGALLTGMTPDERIDQLKIDLAAVPHIQGVNNHMGSKMTTMADQMRQVFTILKKRDLFFIDSRTTAATQCRSAARLFELAFAERDVFLDHVQSREAIAGQIEEFINVAEINGRAIAIGHPHPETYAVLSEKMPEIRKRLRLVPASELARGL